MALHRDYVGFLERIKTLSSDTFDLSRIPQWMEKNTADPNNPDRPWSFKHHEYQIEILSDLSDEVNVRKCSQVGASEMWVRLLLSLMALAKMITIIYVLPTSRMSAKFAKARIDPVIANSEALTRMLNREVDSSELKQLGNSFLYIAGSYGQSAAISVPARGLFEDEVDFCNQTALTTYDSRLGHAVAGEFYKRKFSTPTVDNYGISEAFDNSSQAYYTVKCPSCYEWVAPDFMDDVEIPGFDGNMHMLEKDDLRNPNVLVSEAFIRCPSCRAPLPHQTLCNPQMRQWIHKIPSHPVHGYQIQPFDVPAINPISRTISQLKDYERKKDWVNFKVGVPYSDAESSFLLELIERNATRPALPRPEDDDKTPLAARTVFGLDVGKISWFSLLAHVEGQTRIIYLERIRQDGDNYLGRRVMHLIKVFGCVKGVVDAGPDISASKYLVENNPIGRVWACYYVRQLKGVLENIKLNEEEGIASAWRTGTLDSLAKRINSGKTVFTRTPELDLAKNHFSNLKRVESLNETGEAIASWVGNGDDHYAHSINYAHMALDMLIGGLGDVREVVPCKPMMRRQPIRSEPKVSPKKADPLGLNIARKTNLFCN